MDTVRIPFAYKISRQQSSGRADAHRRSSTENIIDKLTYRRRRHKSTYLNTRRAGQSIRRCDYTLRCCSLSLRQRVSTVYCVTVTDWTRLHCASGSSSSSSSSGAGGGLADLKACSVAANAVDWYSAANAMRTLVQCRDAIRAGFEPD